MTYFNLED